MNQHPDEYLDELLDGRLDAAPTPRDVHRSGRVSPGRVRWWSLGAVLVVFALVLSAAPTASAETVPMTAEQAQAYYIAKICAPNPAIDRLNRAVFRGHPNVRARQMHGKRLRQVRAAIANLRRVELPAGNALVTPTAPWPSPETALATGNVGRAIVADTRVLAALATRAGRRFLRYWNNVVVPHSRLIGRLDVAASKVLNLPPTATC